jgi:16S rRNA (uracil1498-N3)-methyltransferase
MARTDFRTPRLYVRAPLAEGAEVRLDPQQTNYLVNVLRLGADAPVLLFNGRDGEFASKLASVFRKSASLVVGRCIRPQEAPPDVDFLFAPLKHARLDYMAQKAVEMGARRLMPLITRRTQVARVNVERLRANAIEACEQCGVIWAPEVAAPVTLEKALASWPRERLIVFCDEEAPQASPLDELAEATAESGLGLLVGPEGGFDDDERAMIIAAPRVVRLSLGPRILRADTAAVAALALIQATLGDWPKWRRSDRF